MAEHADSDAGVSRRRFLAGTSAAVAASMMPGFVRDALAVAPAGPDLSAVEHVVLFMQENRSFDHYLGTLRGVRGFGDRTPVRLPNGFSAFHQPNLLNLGHTLPFHLDTATTNATCMVAPPMDYRQDLLAFNGGKFDGWIRDRDFASSAGTYLSQTGMGHFERPDLPFYHALADAFTVCDNYFCSTLTQTNPNRLHFFTGTNGASVGRPAVLDNTVPATGFTWTTYAERLEKAGVSWKVYQENDNFNDNALAWFAPFITAKPGDPLYDKGMAKVADLETAFGADVENGTLPQVSWIVASEWMSEHATAKPAVGEDLTARLLKRLFANPDVWSKTVFILNYDENGGFFDHLPSPVPPSGLVEGHSTVGTDGEVVDGKPIGPGFRVPAIVVSPWTTGGWVCSELFDHTSTLRFLERRFGVAEPNISPWRRTVCGDLTSAFDFARHDAGVPALPDTAGRPAQADEQCARWWAPPVAPVRQELPSPEPGRRKARPLPYAFEASARADAGRLWIDMANTGATGAVLRVSPARFRSDGPWIYTLGPGTTLSDYWTTPGGYDLAVHGPNGFLRWLEGDLAGETAPGAAHPNATLRHDHDAVIVDLVNTGSAACVFTVTAERGADRTPHTYRVAPGARAEHRHPVAGDHHWYDLTAKADTGTGFTRRFAGHVETGAATYSE
ncbi:phospholipase C, phosphocholine-specific [Amycolatopsis sp. NBC_00345]|uniref:phosphocholine-specific phospholipase C n=1 Tax=Amycolatopsis sp. NBC_00345 TaxID=2975955 RepID=UPI002E26D867